MNRIWQSEAKGSHVKFTYHSADGEEGYPGNLDVTVVYSWNEHNELTIDYEAQSDAKTVINLTNHAYFNLNGEGNGDILGHTLRLNASKYLPTDSTQIPTGEFADVKGTPMDFTSGKNIGQDINADFEPLKIGKGYDHCWVIDNWHKHTLNPVAVLSSGDSARVLEVFTTQPGVQIYTGNMAFRMPEGEIRP